MRRQRGTRRTTRASAEGSRDTLSVGSSRGHSGELQCEAAAGVFADVVDVDDMVNILAGWDPQRPRTLTSWTPESRVNITGFMLSVRLCCPAGAEIMFLLLSAKSVARLHNIIGYARRAHLPATWHIRSVKATGASLAISGDNSSKPPPIGGNQRCRHRSGQTTAALPGIVGSSGDGARAAAQGGRLCCPRHRVGPENAGREAVSQHNLTHHINPEARLVTTALLAER